MVNKVEKVLNKICYYLKYGLWLVALGLSLYVSLGMCYRVSKSILSLIPIFVPFLLLIILFLLNKILKQDVVNNNLFYNVTCVLVFTVIIFVGLRAIFDKNMILNYVMGYNINFTYFSDFLVFMQVMLYGLVVGDILFIFSKK